MLGRILSSSIPISSAIFANSLAAAMHISSLIIFALTSSVPLKIPGNPRELLTWLGKSDLPVATIFAPASFASQGQTSGIGLAHAKIIESLAIVDINPFETTPGPGVDIASNTSAPFSASLKPPVRPSEFVFRHISQFRALAIENSGTVNHDDISRRNSRLHYYPRNCYVRRTCPKHAYRRVSDLLTDNLECVEETGTDDRSTPLLIVMPHWYSKVLFQSIQNVKTLRLRYIFQIYPAERWLQPSDSVLDFLGSFCAETDRVSIDSSQILEQQAFPLHNGQSSLWPDISKP